MLEPNEKPTEIITVLIDPVVAFFYLWLLQVADHFLFQLPTPFSRNDLKNRDAPVNTELHCIVKCLIDLFAFVEDIVEIEFVFSHTTPDHYRNSSGTIPSPNDPSLFQHCSFH